MLMRKAPPPAPEPDRAPERAPVPDPLLARPRSGEPDWRALAADVRRRFPKTLARLAE